MRCDFLHRFWRADAKTPRSMQKVEYLSVQSSSRIYAKSRIFTHLGPVLADMHSATVLWKLAHHVEQRISKGQNRHTWKSERTKKGGGGLGGGVYVCVCVCVCVCECGGGGVVVGCEVR